MLQDHANMGECRTFLHQELRQLFSATEAHAQLRLIFGHLGYSLHGAIASAQDQVPAETRAQIKEIVRELRSGRPIQYVLGHAWFDEMKLLVNENVLIPRPETEELVSRILQNSGRAPAWAVDLCSGSGCIALALKKTWPQTQVLGVELSEGALQVARKNAELQALKVHWKKANVLDVDGLKLPEGVELIVSNPPYVMEKEKANMESHVLEHEPELALFVPDRDPMLFYRAIADVAGKHLHSGGRVWVEINEQLGAETRQVFLDRNFTQSLIHKDIHEKARFIEAIK